jgi:hypothetical protein
LGASPLAAVHGRAAAHGAGEVGALDALAAKDARSP